MIGLADAFTVEDDLTEFWTNPFDAHPNGAANERVAELLARTLVEKAML